MQPEVLGGRWHTAESESGKQLKWHLWNASIMPEEEEKRTGYGGGERQFHLSCVQGGEEDDPIWAVEEEETPAGRRLQQMRQGKCIDRGEDTSRVVIEVNRCHFEGNIKHIHASICTGDPYFGFLTALPSFAIDTATRHSVCPRTKPGIWTSLACTMLQSETWSHLRFCVWLLLICWE